MRRRLPVYKVWREYKPSGIPFRGKPRDYSYTVIEEIPQTNNPQHHIYKRYNSLAFCLTKFYSKRHIPTKSENRPQTGPDHFFYTIQRHKIEKSVRTKVGRKMKLAVNRGRPEKGSPVKPVSEQLIETFKGLKLKQRIGKFSRNGRRIVA